MLRQKAKQLSLHCPDELYTEEGQEIDNDQDNEFETESEPGTWLQADFWICVIFPLVLTSEKKEIDQTLGYKPNPLVWTLFGRLESKFLKK